MTLIAVFLQINHPPQCPDKPRSPQHPAPRLTAISVPPRVPEMAAARLESPRVLALDAIGAEEDDEIGAERRRNAEHGQNKI